MMTWERALDIAKAKARKRMREEYACAKRYGIRDRITGEWLLHYAEPQKWSVRKERREVFISRERALECRDAWRYRGLDAVLVVLKPCVGGRYS